MELRVEGSESINAWKKNWFVHHLQPLTCWEHGCLFSLGKEELALKSTVTKERIFLSSPHMSDEGYEKEFIEEAFATNWIAPLGANVDGFERELASKVGVKAAAALSSGTAAIHLALKALGVGYGDLVFCQDLTFAATANPIRYQGAIPVFIDSNETWNLCPEALKKGLEKFKKLGQKPKAVIVVHLYGLSADLDPIMEICREYDVPLIEDAAESLGSFYKGKATGTFGELVSHSQFSGHHCVYVA